MYANYDDFIMCHEAFYYLENSDLTTEEIAGIIFNFLAERTLTIHPDTVLRATHITLERLLSKYKKATHNPSWLMTRYYSYQHYNEIVQPNRWMLQYINEDEKFTNNFFRDDYLEGTELDENPNDDPIDKLEFEDTHVIRINDYLSPFRTVRFDWPRVFEMKDSEIDRRVKQKELTGIAIDWYRKNNPEWIKERQNSKYTFLNSTGKTYNAICIACEELFQYVCSILMRYRVNEEKFNKENKIQIDRISKEIIHEWTPPVWIRESKPGVQPTPPVEEDPVYNGDSARFGLVKIERKNKIKISPTKHPSDSSGRKEILGSMDEFDREYIDQHTEGTIHQFLPRDAAYLNETRFNKSSFLPKK